ncbi:hypothetical protein PpBr36_04111 [Pyricularia pennisetigena]|uniref:hypothetical protein n=1 Tax=Pyricularia pennisetigena TaxID=1578925 RepID=UPI0011528750|nr:hypothetical protein PpBr36_04111 [Pyricularia pennisetigena]TLS27261.1 hypothetical protein PpBr36_04111 [Pyricularia pennisetigena]
MPADVSALVAQMNETLAEIHATVAALNDTDHDAKLDALEQERDAAVQALQAAFEREAEELEKRRRAEDEEMAEKRRLEDEEIAARRRREDEERAEAKRRADDEMRAKLEADAREVEEQTDGKMDEVEAEAQRMIEDGERRLAELEEKRKEINRMIDEQMRAPLPTAPARPRRARGDRNSRVMPVAAAGAGAAVAVAAAAAAVGTAAVNSKPSAPETEEAAQSSDNNDVKAPETMEAARGLDVRDGKAADETPDVATPEVAKDKEIIVEESKAEKDETVETKAVSEPVEEKQQEAKALDASSPQANIADEPKDEVLETKDLDAEAAREPLTTDSVQAKGVMEPEEEVLEPKDLDAEAAKDVIEPEEEVIKPKDLDAEVTKELAVDHVSVAPTAEDHASSTTAGPTDASSKEVPVDTAGTSVHLDEEDEIHPVDISAGKANTQSETDASGQPREAETSGGEKKSFFGSWGSKMKSLVAREQQASKSEADTGNSEQSRNVTVPGEAEFVSKDVALGEQATAEPSISTAKLAQDEEEAVLVIKNLDEEAPSNKAEVAEPAAADGLQVPETNASVKQVHEETAEPSAETHQAVEMAAKVAETELMQPDDATEPAAEHSDGATLPVKTAEADEIQDLKEELVIRDLDAEHKEGNNLSKEPHSDVAVPKPEEAVLAATPDPHVSEKAQDIDTHVSDKGQDTDIVEPGTATSEVGTSPHEINGKEDAKFETKDIDSNSDGLASPVPDASSSKADEPVAKPSLDDDEKTLDMARDADDKGDKELTKPTASEETHDSAEGIPTHADNLKDHEAVASEFVPTFVHPNEVEQPELSEPEPTTAAPASVPTSNAPAEDAHGPSGEHGDAAQTAPTSQGFPAPQDATNHANERLSGLDADGTKGAESESEAKSATMIPLKDSSAVLKAADEDVSSHEDSDLVEESKNMGISTKSPVATPAEDQLVVDDNMKAEEVNLVPALAANEAATLSETSLLEDTKEAAQDVESKAAMDKLEDAVHIDEGVQKVEDDKIAPVEEPAATSTDAAVSTAPVTSPAAEGQIDDEKPSSTSVDLQAELSAAEDKDESVPDLDADTTLNTEHSAEESMLHDHLSDDHAAPQVGKDSGPDEISMSEFQEPMLDGFVPVSKSEGPVGGQAQAPASDGQTSPRSNQPPSPPTFPATEPSRARRMSNAAIPGAMSSGNANTGQTVEVRQRPESERFSPFAPIPGTMSSSVANTTQTVTVTSRSAGSAHLSPSTPIPGTMSTGSSSPSFGRTPTPMSATRPALQIPSQLDNAPRGAMLDYIANDPTPVGGPESFVLGPTPTTPIGDRRGRAKHSRGPSTAAAELLTPIEKEPLSAIDSDAGGVVQDLSEAAGQQAVKETAEAAQPETQSIVSQTPVSPVKPSALGSSLADELSQASLDGQGDMLDTDDDDDEYTPIEKEEQQDDAQDDFRGHVNQPEPVFREQTTPRQQSFRGEEQVHDPSAVNTGAAEVGQQQVNDEPDGEKTDSAEPSGVGAVTGAVDAVLGEPISRPQTPVAAVSVASAVEGDQKPLHADADVPAKEEVASDSVDAVKLTPASEPVSEKTQPAPSTQTLPSYDGGEYGASVSAHEPRAKVETPAPTQSSREKLSLEPGHYAPEEASEDDFVTPMQSTPTESLPASPVDRTPVAAEGMATVDGAHNLFDDDETDDESLAHSSVDMPQAEVQTAAAVLPPADQVEEVKDALPKDKQVPAVLAPVQDPVDAFEQKILQHSPEYFPQSPLFSPPAESGGVEKPADDSETGSQKSLEAPTSLDVAAARQMTPLLVPTNPADHMHDISPLALRQESPQTPRKGLADSRHAPKEPAETPLRYSMGQSTPQASLFDMHQEQLSDHEKPHHEPMSWLQGSEAEHPNSASHSRENSINSVQQQQGHRQLEIPEQEEVEPSMYAPRDVTNTPWHSRNDSVPMSMHSQTTLSSAPSSPIHSALARDNREPVIRESWPAVPGQHQEYLAGLGAGAGLDYSNRPRNYSQATTDYGRSRNVSEVSNFDPFGPSSQKSSARDSFQSVKSVAQDKPLPAAPAAAQPAAPVSNNRNSVGAGSSPGSIFQRMRSVFEKPAAEADGSTEPLSRSRPVSGVFVPVKASPRPLSHLDSAGTIREAGNRNSFVLDAAPKNPPAVSSYDLNKGYYYDDPSYGREENENERRAGRHVLPEGLPAAIKRRRRRPASLLLHSHARTPSINLAEPSPPTHTPSPAPRTPSPGFATPTRSPPRTASPSLAPHCRSSLQISMPRPGLPCRELAYNADQDAPPIPPRSPLRSPSQSPVPPPRSPLRTPPPRPGLPCRRLLYRDNEMAPPIPPRSPLRTPSASPVLPPRSPLRTPSPCFGMPCRQLVYDDGGDETAPLIPPRSPLRTPSGSPLIPPRSPLRTPFASPSLPAWSSLHTQSPRLGQPSRQLLYTDDDDDDDDDDDNNMFSPIQPLSPRRTPSASSMLTPRPLRRLSSAIEPPCRALFVDDFEPCPAIPPKSPRRAPSPNLSKSLPSPLRSSRSTSLEVPVDLFCGSPASPVLQGPPLIPPRSPKRISGANYVALPPPPPPPPPLSPPPSPPPVQVTKVTIINIIKEEVPIDSDPTTTSSRTKQGPRRRHELTRSLGYRDSLRSSTTTASHSSSTCPSSAAAGSDRGDFSQRNSSASSTATSPESSVRSGGKTTPRRGSVARIAWLWAEGWRARLRGGGDVVERARWEWKLEDEGVRYQKEARAAAAAAAAARGGGREMDMGEREADEAAGRRPKRKSEDLVAVPADLGDEEVEKLDSEHVANLRRLLSPSVPDIIFTPPSPTGSSPRSPVSSDEETAPDGLNNLDPEWVCREKLDDVLEKDRLAEKRRRQRKRRGVNVSEKELRRQINELEETLQEVGQEKRQLKQTVSRQEIQLRQLRCAPLAKQALQTLADVAAIEEKAQDRTQAVVDLTVPHDEYIDLIIQDQQTYYGQSSHSYQARSINSEAARASAGEERAGKRNAHYPADHEDDHTSHKPAQGIGAHLHAPAKTLQLEAKLEQNARERALLKAELAAVRSRFKAFLSGEELASKMLTHVLDNFKKVRNERIKLSAENIVLKGMISRLRRGNAGESMTASTGRQPDTAEQTL